MMETRQSLLLLIANEPGNNDAWAEFFHFYDGLVRAYVIHRARKRGLPWDDNDFNEVCQDIRVKLLFAMPTFRLQHERGRFRTWLYKVTMSAMVDHARRSIRQRNRDSATGGEQIDFDTLTDGETEDPDWIELYGAAVLRAAMAEVRAQIEPENLNKWASFELHSVQRMKAKEVAARLGISSDLVYQNAKRVFTAVQKICLLKYEEALEND